MESFHQKAVEPGESTEQGQEEGWQPRNCGTQACHQFVRCYECQTNFGLYQRPAGLPSEQQSVRQTVAQKYKWVKFSHQGLQI